MSKRSLRRLLICALSVGIISVHIGSVHGQTPVASIPEIALVNDQQTQEPEYTTLDGPPSTGTTAGSQRWAFKAIHADEANQAGFTGQGVTVAVLDSGIDPAAPNIGGKVDLSADFVDSMPGVRIHGAEVAGVIKAPTDTRAGVGGVAPNVRLISGRVCAAITCYPESIAKGIAWAVAQHADIINLSIGTLVDDPVDIAMINYAIRNGVLVVAAAGNEGCDAHRFFGNDYVANPNCSQRSSSLSALGAIPILGLVDVGAVDSTLARASFSSYGPGLDLAAPGVHVATTSPWAANATAQGTSFAAPFVTGVAALVKEANPSLTPAQIQAILQATASPATPSRPLVWSKCDYDKVVNDSGGWPWTCHDLGPDTWPQEMYTGAGIVDAAAAVKMAQGIYQGTFAKPVDIAQDGTSLNVSWSDTLGGGPYQIFVNGQLQASADSNTYTIENLQLGHSYSITVSSPSAASEPNVVLITSKPKAPAPQIVWKYYSESYGSYAITFSLKDYVQDSTGYVIDQNGVASRCFSTASLKDFECYYFANGPVSLRFATVDAEGNSSQLSDPMQINPTKVSVPAPSNVRFTQTSPTSMHVEWDPIPGVEEYFAEQPDRKTTSSNSVDITGLTPGQVMIFQLQAAADVVWSDGVVRPIAAGQSSLHRYATTPDALGAPSGLVSDVSKDGRVHVTFSAPDGMQGFNVYRNDGYAFGGSSQPEFTDQVGVTDKAETYSYIVVPYRYAQDYAQFGSASESLPVLIPAKPITPPDPPVVVPPVTPPVPPAIEKNSISWVASSYSGFVGSKVQLSVVLKRPDSLTWGVFTTGCDIPSMSGNSAVVTASKPVTCAVTVYAGQGGDQVSSTVNVTFSLPLLDKITLSKAPAALARGASVTFLVSSSSGRSPKFSTIGACTLKQSDLGHIKLTVAKKSGLCKVKLSTSNISGWLGGNKSFTIKVK